MLIAFIILDNPAASLLDMRTVSFVDGKPAFAQVHRTPHRIRLLIRACLGCCGRCRICDLTHFGTLLCKTLSLA